MEKKKLVIIILVATSMLVIMTVTSFVFFSSSDAIFHEQQERIAKMYVSENIPAALEAYRFDIGHYPETTLGLAALVIPTEEDKEKWAGPYLDDYSYDTWGNPYQYAYPGRKNKNGSKGYDLWSFGADGIPSKDDITNWKEAKP